MRKVSKAEVKQRVVEVDGILVDVTGDATDEQVREFVRRIEAGIPDPEPDDDDEEEGEG